MGRWDDGMMGRRHDWSPVAGGSFHDQCCWAWEQGGDEIMVFRELPVMAAALRSILGRSPARMEILVVDLPALERLSSRRKPEIGVRFAFVRLIDNGRVHRG